MNVCINGFGRIGRVILRALIANGLLEYVMRINDLADAVTLASLFKYDSAYGVFPGEVAVSKDGNAIIVDGHKIPVSKHKDPSEAKWKEYGNDVIVIESTGKFRLHKECMMHIQAGAAKVLLTVPPKDNVDAVIVIGCNDGDLKEEHVVVSNASCTTNSIATPLKALDIAIGIEAGILVTVHSATNDQNVGDMVHSDLRRARATLGNLIPATTGAAAAIGMVYVPLDGIMDGDAIRTPTLVGSVSILNLMMKEDTTIETVNTVLQDFAGKIPEIMAYEDDPLANMVLADIVGRTESAIIDPKRTKVVGNRLVKIESWYDNEMGYSTRCVTLLKLMAEMME